MTDSRPTTETERPNVSTEHQLPGDARRPNDRLDKDQPVGGDEGETIHRRSSLTKDD